MSLREEINENGFLPTMVLLVLSIGSANRGFKELFGVDVVVEIFGSGLASGIMLGVGIVGLVSLVELLTDLEVLPDNAR